MNDTAQGLLALLSKHIGKENGLTAGAISLFMDVPMRRVRHLVVELRLDGHAICGHPSTGYFIAANAEELEETCQFLTNRSMTGLQQVSRLRKISMPDLIGQLHLKT